MLVLSLCAIVELLLEHEVDMATTKYWIAVKRDGSECLVTTFTDAALVFNADGTAAKQVSEEEAKAKKAKVKKERKKK